MRLVLLLALIGIGSCTNPLCGCTPPPQLVVLDGSLRNADDAALPGYRVRTEQAFIESGSCGSYADAGVRAVTDNAGAFQLILGGGGDSLCLRFFAGDTTAGSPELAIAGVWRVRPALYPFDSVTVPLVLEP